MNLIQLFIQLSDVTEFIRPLQLQPEASRTFTTQISDILDMDRVRRDLGKKSPPRVGVKGAKCLNVICDILLAQRQYICNHKSIRSSLQRH